MPGTRRTTPDTEAAGDVVAALHRAGVPESSDSRLDRVLHASDASLYRVEPLAVTAPRDRDELVAVTEVCRALGVPLTLRGAGTSIAGNAVGPGVVALTRHVDRVLEVDGEAGTAVVEPGVVHAALQRRALPLGWRYGPDPSTHDRATLGGMVGNNACGSRALGYGRTSDTVLGLDVVAGTGDRLVLGDLDGAASAATTATRGLVDALTGVVASDLATVRTECGRFPRQVSGYSLEHLLPERGPDLPRFLVGSEGTLATVLRARVRLAREPAARTLVALGYPSMVEAADAVPAVLRHRPVACEGLDARIVDVVRARRGPAAVPPLPRGAGWLFVELTGGTPEEVAAAATSLVADAGALDALVVPDRTAAAALWRIREDGAGLSSRTPAGAPAHAGWEDAAVPPERLGSYLRGFESLLEGHGLTGLPYGHFGDGCLHIRIDFPLDRPGGTTAYRSFVEDAARLAAAHGGSVSGEHGDGRARSELLPLMYSPRVLALFEQVKDVMDPRRLLNPGVLVDPDPLDAAIRVAAARPVTRRELPGLALALERDGGDLSRAVHRCTGVGTCLADHGDRGAVMCPSYLATGREQDSTRGRARVLQDVVAGRLGPDGWRCAELAEVLDLCLACKGCATDCPTGTDVAAYKSQALAQRYRRRPRPRSHYALGWLPTWTRLGACVPGGLALAATLLGMPWARRLLARAGGVDARRELPAPARETFRAWFAGRAAPPGEPVSEPREVVLFVDTFTDAFAPEVGRAAVSVLEEAGHRVLVTDQAVCCGLTWASTGQLGTARRRGSAAVAALLPHVRAGRPVVGLEPSCLATLRSDVPELVPAATAGAAREVAAATRTLAEVLASSPGWPVPDLSDVRAVAQPHCHQHAVLGFGPDAALLRAAGARVDVVGGCCGLAGNWGLEPGHHDVSVAVAGLELLPAVERLGAGGVVLADGFSCRTQLASLTGVRGVHLAELLDSRTPAGRRRPA
ncbi:MAG TPA: FAD-linked oxidase C-terminal domain-containing protein [Dermatophilaceae bacterium]|nr:FAD-linked oxidase C-terminal domain-containing protein [Dermatophilaceae bacterium]